MTDGLTVRENEWARREGIGGYVLRETRDVYGRRHVYRTWVVGVADIERVRDLYANRYTDRTKAKNGKVLHSRREEKIRAEAELLMERDGYREHEAYAKARAIYGDSDLRPFLVRDLSRSAEKRLRDECALARPGAEAM